MPGASGPVAGGGAAASGGPRVGPLGRGGRGSRQDGRATLKSARQVIHHGHNTVKIADKPLYRYMSRAEANAIRETGLLRGGRAGETFWTDSRFTSAARAESRLSLGSAPEVRMEFRLKSNPTLERAGTRVQPANGGTGLGREYSTFDRVEVEIINVQPFTH